MSSVRLDAVDRGLPRRLSTNPEDRSYDEAATRLSDRISIMLDGVELPEVASYDVDKGFITRRIRRDGAFILDGKGVPAHETLRGSVEVRWIKRDEGDVA
jgi:hypothetical protein